MFFFQSAYYFVSLTKVFLFFFQLKVKQAKERKKGDKIVSDSQERAYWRVYRPPPGFVSSLEQCPVPNRNRNGAARQRRRTLEDCRREVSIYTMLCTTLN